MAVLLGLSKVGWRCFRQQQMFVVHFLRKNPGMSLCRRHVPYQHRFEKLPKNAIFCDKCLRAK